MKTPESYREALLPCPYRQAFEDIWTHYCGQFLDLESAELIRDIGTCRGLIVERPVNWDTDARVMEEWGLEDGDPIYIYSPKSCTPQPPKDSELESLRADLAVAVEALNKYRIYDRLGMEIIDGCVVHWTDGGDDLSLENRIKTRWDRVAVVNLGADTKFTVIDSPREEVKRDAHTFHMGNFIYKDTAQYLTVVAASPEHYHAKFKNAGECMTWVLSRLTPENKE